MRTWWQSCGSFSKAERYGIGALLLLFLLLLGVYVSMPLLLPAPSLPEPDPGLLAAYERFQTNLPEAEPPDKIRGRLFTFDPNTLDSIGFIELGMRPRTVHLLLNWRRKGKQFYRKEDLRPLYTLTGEEYSRLAPYIAITSVRQEHPDFARYYQEAPLPAVIDLNTADSATLVRLPGIGTVLSHRIIERRRALGGFLRHDQLLEVYRFPDTVFRMLSQRLRIAPESVRKLSLNSAGLEELSSHPYIGEKMANNILLYRQGLGRFHDIAQLRQVPLMNEEIYRKIAPYFELD